MHDITAAIDAHFAAIATLHAARRLGDPATTASAAWACAVAAEARAVAWAGANP